MRGHTLVVILLCAAQAYVFGPVSACARRGSGRAACRPVFAGAGSAGARSSTSCPATAFGRSAFGRATSSRSARGSAALAETAQAPAPADPVVAGIRSKLADASIRKDANPADLAALEAFYAERASPLWVTEMGFSAKAQAALFEIEKADDWGLDAAAFDLPPADALPASAGGRRRSPRSSSISPS